MVLKVAMAKGKKEKVEKAERTVELEKTEVQLAQVVETTEVLETAVVPGTEAAQVAVARMVVEEEKTALVLVDKSTTSRCRNF